MFVIDYYLKEIGIILTIILKKNYLKKYIHTHYYVYT